ncbi:putative low molecular weight protein-tyrosine-phosphatase [Streptomyces sp. MBT84]|nr:putative low molecular weight protein-tyrosine-phosphatase [Streptomyces sp. MBT84]
MTYRVCFVCTGNICRSPMAESVFRARVEEAGLDELVEVDSAGTGDWHEGDGADPRTATVLEEHGYGSDHVARQFRDSWFSRLDLVIALDSGHLKALRRLAPTPRTRRRSGSCAPTIRRPATTSTCPILITGGWTGSRPVLRWWRRRATGCSPR